MAAPAARFHIVVQMVEADTRLPPRMVRGIAALYTDLIAHKNTADYLQRHGIAASACLYEAMLIAEELKCSDKLRLELGHFDGAFASYLGLEQVEIVHLTHEVN